MILNFRSFLVLPSIDCRSSGRTGFDLSTFRKNTARTGNRVNAGRDRFPHPSRPIRLLRSRARLHPRWPALRRPIPWIGDESNHCHPADETFQTMDCSTSPSKVCLFRIGPTGCQLISHRFDPSGSIHRPFPPHWWHRPGHNIFCWVANH